MASTMLSMKPTQLALGGSIAPAYARPVAAQQDVAYPSASWSQSTLCTESVKPAIRHFDGNGRNELKRNPGGPEVRTLT